MIAWGRALNNLFNFTETETGLVRMFRTEYNKEYRFMKKSGVVINDDFVKRFLDVR